MNYEKIYNQIILRAKSRELNCYVERHHIIPKCMGGTNDKDNLVKLTAKEHFICHKLLCEIHPTNDKLKYALWSMSNQKNLLTQKRDYNVGSKEYERLKIMFSTLNSKTHRGKKYTNETKEKMSKSHLGEKLSPETIEKLKNRIVSNETREKRSESLIGILKTEEHKMSMRKPKSVESWSKGMKNRWNNNQLLNNKIPIRNGESTPLESSGYTLDELGNRDLHNFV